jgi:hypothetical protein
MLRKVIVVFIILSSLSLFRLIFIPSMIIKGLELLVPIFMLFLLLLYRIYDNSYRFKPKFRIEIILILCAVVLSMFGAYYFHRQSFAVTAMSQRYVYFFLFYPLLHALKPKLEDVAKIILYLSLFYAAMYLIQTAVYPLKLVDAPIFRDRGTLRVFMPGASYLFIAYLISLSILIRTYNLKYLLLCTLAIIIFALLGTRQLMGPVALVTILSVLLSRKVKSRALTIVLILIAMVPAYFLFMDIFGAMLEVSQKQVSNYNQDVRFKAAIFFLFEFFPNKLSYIIGNGVPSSNSAYGMQVNAFKDLFGYYQSDIGIIGDFTKFGIFLVIAQVSLYFRIIFMRLSSDFEFIKYYIIATAITMFLGTAFGDAGNIVIICICLYLIDISSYYNPTSTENLSVHPEEETETPVS